MRRLLNSLFVTTEDAYLALDGENVVVKHADAEMGRFPLHMFESIISFTYAGASPALMGACASRGIGLSFCRPSGRFLARACGEANGNVLLRRTQYRIADDLEKSCEIARTMIFGKVHNARWSIDRTLRDHRMRVDAERMERSGKILQSMLPGIMQAASLDSLRGIEGEAASVYFSVFDEMILKSKEHFYFHGRNRRPPLDNVNSMLSFVYGLLRGDCASALETAGLDSYVGFLHQDRPGRSSLALDLMEELRTCFADRFVLTVINTGIVKGEDFDKRESGAVVLSDNGRKKILTAWQERKRETFTHPFTKEKLPWGLAPYVQAMLLARYLRGDIDGYPPLLWK